MAATNAAVKFTSHRLPLLCLYLASCSNAFLLKNSRSHSIMAQEAIGLSDISSQKNGSSNLIPWRERIDVSIARSRKIRGGNYVQIATVDAITNEPRCRTVVFRGFLLSKDNQTCNTMKMITDRRSLKVEEATINKTAELVWWFAKSSEQFRVRGRVEFVSEGDDRFKQWGNLSDMAREQFYWREPGDYVPQKQVPTGGRSEIGKVLPPPDTFLLMLLHPTRVDYLRLGDNFRQIDEIDGSTGKWTEKRVNP